MEERSRKPSEQEGTRDSARTLITEVKKESTLKSTNEDVQRAIEGLKDIPDEELQEFLDDEDFMEGLDVVDAWEGDEERNKDTEHKSSRTKERDQRRPSRDRHRRDRKGSYGRERFKREEKKREEIRRDPVKSTKDIERDKIRTKRDNESKLLAEKEKAIKHLLDSDDVVPPGTEAEAIQSITERQNMERAQLRIQRSRERRRTPVRRRSPDRIRLSPLRRRSPLLLTPERRRTPFKISMERHRSSVRSSPDRRRSPVRFNCERRSPFGSSPDRLRSPERRLSWEGRTSTDRRWSIERHRRRLDVYERRRSRSRDRQRSRSLDRVRRRASRSPVRRYSPRRRSRTRSTSSERRTRKRSPFLNELARQLRNEAMIPPHLNTGYPPPAPSLDGISPMISNIVYQQEEPGPAYMHPPAPMGSQGTTTGGLPITGAPSHFINFDMPPQPINFDPVPPVHPPITQTEYSSGPVLYNQQGNNPPQGHVRPPLLPNPVQLQQPPSQLPQPVPAPAPIDHMQINYSSSHAAAPPSRRTSSQTFETVNTGQTSSSSSKCASKSSKQQAYRDSRSSTPYNGYRAPKEERLKTPEPPVISDVKQFEKTSLSSLLEASVSAKDSAGFPVLYPGFKPDILRHCEHALRELPLEDPRLSMKGRFFYDPKKETVKNEQREHSSNSILLQKGKNKIYWEGEAEEQHTVLPKHALQTHQKICQTDETETDSKFVQATVTMVDFEVQVYPHDLQQTTKEGKRPIMDRLDWNMRETFDYTPKFRESDDLRWSLNNSAQRRSWNRNTSPARCSGSDEHLMESISSLDSDSRTLKLTAPVRNRDTYPNHKPPIRDHFVRERFSPSFRLSVEDRDDFHEERSDRSRGKSPHIIMESDDEDIEGGRVFPRGSDWHGRGKPLRGRSTSMKSYPPRGKHSGGRSYRGRGGFRGKF